MAAHHYLAVDAVKEMLFSPSWYRVSELKPRLRRQAAIHRHVYRGQPWYVMEDRASDRHHRFTAATYSLIGLFDGTRTVDAVWRRGVETLGDDAPTQDDMIRLLAQLHGAGLMPTDVSPETEDLLRRFNRSRRQSILTMLASPFSLKLPLFDPDRLLDALQPLARLLFSWFGLLIWLAVVGTGGALAALHADELLADVSDRVLAPWTLAVMVIAYPFMKLLHELGHGLAVKRWGGRVHDVGVMFVVFMPLPYVDASAASTFPAKHRRIVVDAAGILVELFLAALAMILWLQVDYGPLRSFLYTVMLIGTLSTLIFNANPLLRFDGYYMLSDQLEIPNLGQRSQKYLAYLSRRYLFGISTARSPVTARGERGWFFFYGLASAAYKVFLAVVISLFVASAYPVVGGLLGAYAVLLMIVLPVGKAMVALVADPDFAARRLRVGITTATLGGLAVFLLAFLPLPRQTIVDGVTVTTDEGLVRAQAEGFLDRFLVEPGSPVKPGDRLVLLSDPTVEAEARALSANVRALEARYRSLVFVDRVEATLVEQELKAARAERERMALRLGEQVVVASKAGIFSVPNPADQPGRFFQRGALIGVVIDPARVVIATAVRQADVGAIREGVVRVDLLPPGRDAETVPARLLRLVPSGRNEVADPALAVSGGGSVPLDPRSKDRPRTLDTVFQIDVEPVGAYATAFLGERFLVRFAHAPDTLAEKAGRALRRVFLEHFGV